MTADTQLTIRQEILSLAGDPSVPLEQIEGRMAELYNQAEAAGDANNMTLVAQSWEHVQIMHASAIKAHELAVAAKEAALEYQSQRDEALEELEETSEDRDAARADLEEVYEAMDEPFGTDNARVRDLVEFIEEVSQDQMETYYDDMIHEQAYDEAVDNIAEGLVKIDVSDEDARKFADVIVNSYLLPKLTDDQQRQIREFVTAFAEGLR